MFFKSTLKEVQSVKKVLSFTDFNASLWIHFGNRILQFDRFIGCTAGIALVAPSTILATRWTGPLHVAVWKESPRTVFMNLVILFHRLAFKEPALLKCLEIFLNHPFVFTITCSVK